MFEEARGLEQRSRLHTKLMYKVSLAVFLLARPTVPPLRETIQHAGLGVRLEYTYLLHQLISQPHIICIQESDIFPLGVRDPQISGCAHPEILMTRVLNIMHFMWILIRIGASDGRTPID